MTSQSLLSNSELLDIIVAVDGDRVIAELDIHNNASVREGDQYIATWDDGAITIMRVVKFESANKYTNTISRRTEAMREGVAGMPQTLTARKAYQIKLAELIIEGELLPDGSRFIGGASRTPDVLIPLQRITDETVERFVSSSDGNVVLGHLRSGSRVLDRVAKIYQNFGGERMIIFGMPGKGKSQLVRSILSQAMAQQENPEGSLINNQGG